MAKGSLAKEAVTKRIAQAFGEDYIGEVDKKLYVWAIENGEKIQIAIAMTCPKVPVQTDGTVFVDNGGAYDFENMAVTTTASANNNKEPLVISMEEKKNISNLITKLGL